MTTASTAPNTRYPPMTQRNRFVSARRTLGVSAAQGSFVNTGPSDRLPSRWRPKPSFQAFARSGAQGVIREHWPR